MKNTILTVIALAVMTVSCNQKSKETDTIKATETTTATELYACPMHPEITGEKGAECSECGMELTEKVPSAALEKKDAIPATEKSKETTAATTTNTAEAITIDGIVSSYLKLKNALVNDDSNGAANAGKVLFAAFDKANSNSIVDAKLKNKFISIAINGKKHVKHISDHAGELAHQREYFALVSADVFDLITTFGSKQKLYQEYCPMYNEGKDGYWISESKEVKNPYYGAEMLSCGRMVKAI